jgi:hypothetical protein
MFDSAGIKPKLLYMRDVRMRDERRPPDLFSFQFSQVLVPHRGIDHISVPVSKKDEAREMEKTRPEYDAISCGFEWQQSASTLSSFSATVWS